MSSILTVGTGIALMGSPGLRTLAEDFFTDADSTLLSAHVPDSGGAYTLHAPYVANGDLATIIGNRAVNADDGTMRLYRHSAIVPADCEVEADVVMRSDNALSEAGVAARVHATLATYYSARYDTNPNGFRIVKIVNGSLTAITSSVSGSITVDTPYRMKLTMQGSLLRLYVDGVLMSEATDTSITAAGSAGVWFNLNATATTGVHLDYFRVRA